MNGWLYAFWHQLARGLASAGLILALQGKVESFGLKLEGWEAFGFGIFVFVVIGVPVSKAESWFEERKKREADGA
jgi:hypothetical protein